MINKFNFYDIYGYFLPGLVLLALLVLPYGMATGSWPGSGQLVTALLGIPLAYVVGHLLRCLQIFSSTDKDPAGRVRFPSDILLDDADRNFAAEFKSGLREAIKAKFKIDVESTQDTDMKRQTAFLLCRSILIDRKAVSYGEQFEGMYALMRGLTTAFLLSAAHLFGWILSALPPYVAITALVVFAMIAANVLARKPTSSNAVAFLSIGGLIFSGYLVSGYRLATRDLESFIAMTFAALLLSWMSYRAFKYFAWEFPKAIYRDFYTHTLSQSESPKQK